MFLTEIIVLIVRLLIRDSHLLLSTLAFFRYTDCIYRLNPATLPTYLTLK